jgi:hypothetical protein
MATPRQPAGHRLKRVGLVTLMALAAVNVWTGSPLLALWIGSRVASDGPPTMGPIVLVVAVFGAMCFVLVRVLARLQDAYARLTGTTGSVRRQVPWLRSMRGERPHDPSEQVRPSPLEVILVLTVVLCVVAFEVWFFLFAGSSIGKN